MAVAWDIFVDEQKDGGTIRRIGAFVCEQGVTPQLQQLLRKPYDKVRGSAKVKIGSIHWSELGDVEARIAKEWVDDYGRAPLSFFIRVDARPKETKRDLITRLVRFLEASDRVPRGLVPSTTVLHFDAESNTDAALVNALRKELPLAGAYPLDDRASPLLQLVDLLLGISEAETSGQLEGVSSAKGKIKADVLEHARKIFIEAASLGRRNALVVLGDAETFLFEK